LGLAAVFPIDDDGDDDDEADEVVDADAVDPVELVDDDLRDDRMESHALEAEFPSSFVAGGLESLDIADICFLAEF